MEELNLNVRRRPYLRRNAKSKFETRQPVQNRPQKKKRSECDGVENNKKKRRKSNKNATAPVRHRIMTRSRSKELPQPISNFGQASQEAVKNSPQAQTATKHSPETPIAVDGAEDVIDVAATVDSAGADTQAVTPDTIAAPKSPASGQTNIPQGIRPYDESAPILADGYGHDIHEFYFKRECAFRPSILEIKARQTEITAKMRSILLDWLVEVAQEFHLNDDTLFLSIDMIDRSISLMMVKKSRLQLLGCACLLIASKYEEIHPPTVEELAYISDDTYTTRQILKMEKLVLNILSFEISVPTARTFLARFVRCASSDKKEQILCAVSCYLASELCLLDINWLGRKPSLLAASVLYLARKTLKAVDDPAPVWDATLEHYTHYNTEQLRSGAIAVHKQHVAMHTNKKLMAIKDKYSSANLSGDWD